VVDGGAVGVRINLDMQREVARKYNIRTIPHLVLTDSYGTELARLRGLVSVQELAAAVNALPPDLSELNRLDRNLQENHNDFESLLGMGQRLMAAGFWESGSSYYSRALRHNEAR